MKTNSFPFASTTKTASDIVRQAHTLASAAPELIPFLCGRFDCQWGTFWQVDARKVRLMPAFCWNNESLRAEKLRRDTDSRSLALSEGTAGHVWRTGTPVCTNDIVRDMCLPRSLDAADLGLRGGIWFPIRTTGATLGVVELLGRESWSCDERFMLELQHLGFSLGEVAAGQ